MHLRRIARCWPVWLVVCAVLIGCKPAPPTEEEPSQPQARAPAAEPETTITETAPPPPPEPIIDDPGAPAEFPADHEVPGWYKRTGVRVATGEAIRAQLADELLRRLVGFQLNQIAWAEYEYAKDAQSAVATVYLLQSAGADEAFGIGTVLAGITPDALAGMVTHAASAVTHEVVGRDVVLIVGDVVAPLQPDASWFGLLHHLVGAGVAEAVRPAVLNALPTDGPQPADVWLVHRVAAVAAAADDLPLDHADEIDQLLGLTQTRAWLLVARYPVPGGVRDNCVWVCAYPTADHASAAHLTYRNLMERLNPEWTRSTFLKSPIGRYLLGTWTIEEECLAPTLDRIAARLADLG